MAQNYLQRAVTRNEAVRSGLHERREQFKHLSGVESALFVLRVARLRVPLAPSEVHGLPEYVLGRILAKVFAGAGKRNAMLILDVCGGNGRRVLPTSRFDRNNVPSLKYGLAAMRITDIRNTALCVSVDFISTCENTVSLCTTVSPDFSHLVLRVPKNGDLYRSAARTCPDYKRLCKKV